MCKGAWNNPDSRLGQACLLSYSIRKDLCHMLQSLENNEITKTTCPVSTLVCWKKIENSFLLKR
ncbi:hypothetical protein BpHYR1_000923 [Brachionus plicatilis]|uniref:Uncharacterized protein n=1 Tax=Brachionus plicatilis TaxID=10195 RepID=A0A3M7QBT3_BRAPC|nr:hypothetical protein BpHYR1_000923 [Brachionus plicatilis]